MHFKNEKIKWLGRYSLSLINRFLLHFMDVKKLKMLNSKYYLRRNVDLQNPKKLNEKLLCNYYDSDMSLLGCLADKYSVREYVREKGLEEILVPIYGVYQSFDEIDFDVLPNKFMLKATHGCDMNYACLDKSKIDIKGLCKRINFWLRYNFAYMSLELHYAQITPRIICEKYLETKDEIVDYKFHCCNGKVQFVLVCSERSKELLLNVFMPDWTPRQEVLIDTKCNLAGISKPKQLERMIEIAEKLAQGFPFVRVDLYEVDERIYFGELTFTPATGVMPYFNDSFLLEQGEKWS